MEGRDQSPGVMVRWIMGKSSARNRRKYMRYTLAFGRRGAGARQVG